MEPTITCGKHFANHCKMTGSRFEDVCLGDAEFDNVSLTGARFHNINFSDVTITAANFGGATFKHIGPAPDESGKHPLQRPILFTEADLNASRFERVNLKNVEIKDCEISGMKINGILIEDLLAKYNDKE